MSIDKTIRDQIDQKVKLFAVGNTNRKLRDVAVDLINASKMNYKEVAAGCFLCTSTVKKLAQDKTKNPQSETLERVFRYFEYNVILDRVSLKGKYQNQPKKK